METSRLFGRKGTKDPEKDLYKEIWELISEHAGHYLMAHRMTGNFPQEMQIFTMEEMTREFNLVR